MSCVHVAKRSGHASTTRSCRPTPSNVSDASHQSFSARCIGTERHPRLPPTLARTRAARTSWPSLKMSALTTTVSPSTAFGGCCGSGVRGRMSSITMRPSTILGYQPSCFHETLIYGRVQMKALRSFTVRPRLPEPLVRLEQLAMNLRWSWDDRARDLFRWLDPDGWEES